MERHGKNMKGQSEILEVNVRNWEALREAMGTGRNGGAHRDIVCSRR